MLDHPMNPIKSDLISDAYAISPFSSIADLGACWGVNGAYSFFAEQVAGERFERGVIVDQNITELTRERASPKIELVSALLGSDEARQAVGKVDALIMFDILLHQVGPDWDEFLKSWIQQTDTLIIYNQMWIQSAGKSIRFIDNGREWYKENVYFTNLDGIDNWFNQHDQFDAQQNKPKKDIHNFWQWGITASDLISVITEAGFDLELMKNYGPWGPERPWIVNNGFVFVRSRYR
jgi:hypothetical protein